MTRAPIPLRRVLHRPGVGLERVLARIDQQDRLLRQLRPLLPVAVREHCIHADVRRGELVLFVESPAWASRLRYVVPQLLEQARHLVQPPPRRLAIRVLPPDGGTPRRRRAPPPLSHASARIIRAAADTVTDDRLRAALWRLAKRAVTAP